MLCMILVFTVSHAAAIGQNKSTMMMMMMMMMLMMMMMIMTATIQSQTKPWFSWRPRVRIGTCSGTTLVCRGLLLLLFSTWFSISDGFSRLLLSCLTLGDLGLFSIWDTSSTLLAAVCTGDPSVSAVLYLRASSVFSVVVAGRTKKNK